LSDINIETSYVMDLSKEILVLAGTVVVKREDIARSYETLETIRTFDEYSSALMGTDTFDTYESFEVEILEAAGLTELEIATALLSKKNIPEAKRDAVVGLKRQKVLAEYVETNNYYRTLSGLPLMEDSLEIFITEPVAGVDINKPIHEMTNDEIFILNNLGFIDQLIDKYPERNYLKYLGANKVNNITARHARRFDIIRIGEIANRDLKERFNISYERSKTYILNNYYKRRLSLDQTYFDAYIGFLIMMNALIMVVNDSINIFNSKEFTNELTIKALLQSHDLDIFDDIPIVYRKKIADNIKSLIVSKGTDEVIGKIFKIFGFDNITIRKFILVKEHLKDSEDKYIFEYESDGVTPKYDEMFNIHFAQVDINSPNIDNEIRRPENRIAYTDVTANDIYWGGYESDEAIRQKLLKEPFNYIDTDYININTAYEMSKLSFEVSYFFGMILDLKLSTERLIFTEPFQGQSITLFYAITMISALLSKKIGWAGDIITDPADIAYVNKFNFERSIPAINAIMAKYNYTSPINFATVLPSGQMNQPAELVELFFKNKEIYDSIMAIKTSTRNLNEYLACKEILEYVAQSKLSASVYTKPNNTIADTYLDYLQSHNMVLANFIDTLHDSEIDTALFKLLTSLEEYVQSDRFSYVFLKIPAVSSENVLKTYMLKLINTFKAFTINIFSMSITYNIDDMTNNVKLIDSTTFEGEIYAHTNVTLTDDMGVRGTGTLKSTVAFRDELTLISQT